VTALLVIVTFRGRFLFRKYITLLAHDGNHHICTYTKGDRQSVIDYVTASVHIVPFVQSLDVGPAPLPCSDHVPLVLVVNTPVPVERDSLDSGSTRCVPRTSRQLKYEDLPTRTDLDQMLKNMVRVLLPLR
jgi:hypothetical protein